MWPSRCPGQTTSSYSVSRKKDSLPINRTVSTVPATNSGKPDGKNAYPRNLRRRRAKTAIVDTKLELVPAEGPGEGVHEVELPHVRSSYGLPCLTSMSPGKIDEALIWSQGYKGDDDGNRADGGRHDGTMKGSKGVCRVAVFRLQLARKSFSMVGAIRMVDARGQGVHINVAIATLPPSTGSRHTMGRGCSVQTG